LYTVQSRLELLSRAAEFEVQHLRRRLLQKEFDIDLAAVRELVDRVIAAVDVVGVAGNGGFMVLWGGGFFPLLFITIIMVTIFGV